MRIIRTVITGLLAALLGLSAFAGRPRSRPTRPCRSAPSPRSRPAGTSVDFNTFNLKGVVTSSRPTA